ncbi:PstS family phosphate ABC transporter substrate-binding protein [Alkalihalobacillus sp. AL-G]|uniref:PstS family phosphate ABC transporter substrate-binding protein n=1 Tax=Alkalihalobacillus sp. AL-G TaxID=2926399 RepID=UPI00272D5FD4|nr:PstS family phosphate ABC transporter substrate-binding protein [Alkalihalobacillus sp. AL-G]WLD92080.1 PstS family phosphate ABC transporter substrate-binding protein [Alkalihalobacillus sp. AL-G]
MKAFKKSTLFMMLAALLIVATACGNGDGSGSAAGGEGGDVKIDGSSTVFPIMAAVSEEFKAEYPEVKVPVGVSGTGGGFERFTKGETDLSNASRPIKEEEKKIAKENGIEFTELKLAFDGLSVVVNKENDFVDKLTVEELNKMWKKDSEVKTWADVREGWPEEEIKFFSPGTDSGTFDYFNEVILEEEGIRKDVQLSENDNILVKGVTGSANGIGYFGYAYYLENKDSLNIVPIVNAKGEEVKPTFETIQSGKYEPLSRPLFTYVNNKSIKENEAVYNYVIFTLENAGKLAEEVGYVALPQEQYDTQIEKIKKIAGK